MYTNAYIKRVVAILMLCVFIFSITPKQWLHNVITDHKDSYAVSIDGKAILTTTGFHCNCDNLVVQSPFINYDLSAELNVPEFFVQHRFTAISNLISTDHFFSSLRGPPCRI